MPPLINNFQRSTRLVDATVLNQIINAVNTLTVKIVTSNVYTFLKNDNISSYVIFTNVGGCLVTVPANKFLSYPIGTKIYFEQGGVGVVTVQGDVGVTVNGNALATINPHDQGVLTKTDSDTWTLVFDQTVVSSVARTQRSITATPIVIASNDQILNCNIAAPATCALPAAAIRSGIPLTFKDVGAQFGANNLVITPNGAETIDSAANITLKNNRQEVTLIPFTDGVNTGWFIG